MPFVPPLLPRSASADARQVYEEFHRRMQFPSPPNFIMTQGHSATAARGTWEAVRNVLVLGEIPRWVKELVFVAISKDRDCRYCTAAHIACCRMLGVDSELLDSLVRDVETMTDVKVRTMVRFALKCSRDPRTPSAADFDSLRGAGLSQGGIVELIAMSALAGYANIIADATGMEPDEMFGDF